MSLTTRYNELLSLTQIYLHREYKAKDFRLATPASRVYFQNKVVAQKPVRAAQRPEPPRSPSLGTQNTQQSTPKQQTSSPQNLPRASFPDPNPPQTEPRIPPETPTPQPNPAPKPPEQPKPNQDPQIPNLKSQFGKKSFTLEPLSAPAPYQMDPHHKEIITSKFPHLQIYETIPDDTVARKLKNAWQKDQTIPPVLILTFIQDEQHLIFLKNIAKAISLCHTPARVISGLKIEAEKKWDKLVESSGVKLIISCDYGFFLQPGLKQYYREEPQQGKHFIGNISLLLLSDLNLYLEQPQLKPLLWQAICKELK